MIQKKKNRKKAFSMAEMLATVLILSFVVAASVTGIVAISTSYRKVLQTSNAEELCNLLNTAINGELSYANYVETTEVTVDTGETDADGNPVTETTARLDKFYSAKYRMCSYQMSAKKQLELNSDALGTMQVLADDAYAGGLEVHTLEIYYNETDSDFSVHLVIGDSSREKIAETSFKVKALNARGN